jgi:hypothetical protein
MTTIQQPLTRWVPSRLLAIACMAAMCMLLSATAARAGTPRSASQLASGSGSSATSQPAQSVATAHAAAVRTLASQTRALRTCKRVHPRHCAAATRAVQRAAKRLIASQARRAKSTRRSAGHSLAVPTVTVAGSTLSWNAGGGGSISSSAGGTPSTGSESSTGSASAAGSGSGTTPPLESLESTSSNFQPGLNSGWETTYDVSGATKLGAKLVRLDVNIEATTQELEPIVAAYAAHGIRVLPMADFYGTLPTPAEADNLANWAKAFGQNGTYWTTHAGGQFAIQSIEFGNETSYSYQYTNDTPAGYASRAQTYALRFEEAVTAIRSVNPNVGLLAQGDAGNAGPIWVENMFKAVPDLGQLVAGWTIHPYGPGWRPRLESLISQTAAQGAPSTIPIDITEYGMSTDDGRCLTENYGWNPCMTYQEAAEGLTRTVTEMHQMLGDRLGLFMLYQVRDQQATGATNEREDYFGALQHELQPKGAYTTAVQELMAS